MSGIRIKPFTLFLYICLFAFIIFGPGFFIMRIKSYEPMESLIPDIPEWSGRIILWDISYANPGTGSRAGWMGKHIRAFEKKHPGVFIEMRQMPPERAKIYFQSQLDMDILPDIISLEAYDDFLNTGILEDISEYMTNDYLDKLHPVAKQKVSKGDQILGIPWMMGSYALYINQEHLGEVEWKFDESFEMDYKVLDDMIKTMTFEEKEGRKSIMHYGFVTYNTPYNRPILSMIYNESGKIQGDTAYSHIHKWYSEWGAVPEGIHEMDFAEAWNFFGERKTAGIMLGDTRVLYLLRAKKDSGKGFEYKMFPIPLEGKDGLFLDQVEAYGVIRKDDAAKRDLCIKFLSGLINEEKQESLKEIGMFPVLNGMDYMYEDDKEMLKLYQSLGDYRYGPFHSNSSYDISISTMYD